MCNAGVGARLCALRHLTGTRKSFGCCSSTELSSSLKTRCSQLLLPPLCCCLLSLQIFLLVLCQYSRCCAVVLRHSWRWSYCCWSALQLHHSCIVCAASQHLAVLPAFDSWWLGCSLVVLRCTAPFKSQTQR